MRFLMFSDIHGNLAALEALLHRIEKAEHLSIDTYRCLGDIVGYYYAPLEVWNKVKLLDANYRLGNHDYELGCMLANELSIPCSEWAKTNSYVKAPLSDHYQQALADAQYTQLRDSFCDLNALSPLVETTEDGQYTLVFVHGTPHAVNPIDYCNEYLHPQNKAKAYDDLKLAIEAARNLRGEGQRVIVFVGHTHSPMIAYPLQKNGREVICFAEGQWTTEYSDNPISLTEGELSQTDVLIVNGGSVGQPRMGSSYGARIHAAHFDTTSQQLRMIGLDYGEQYRQMFAEDMRRWQLDSVIKDKLFDNVWAGLNPSLEHLYHYDRLGFSLKS